VTLAHGLTDTSSRIAAAAIPGFIVAQFDGALAATLLFRWRDQLGARRFAEFVTPLSRFLARVNCQLCALPKKLVKSHVIPDNLNRVLRDVLGDDPNAPMLTIDKRTGKTKRYPMGVYDKQILCGECDGSFSPWEEHARDVLFTKHSYTGVLYNGQGQPHCYTLLGADYTTLKLFVLSVVWRASISGNAFFGNVDLGQTINDGLKTRLLAADPGGATDFSVRIAQYHSVDIPLAAFEPREQVIDGIHYVVLYLPGYKILVQVDEKTLPADHDAVLTPANPIIVRLLNYRTSPERRAVVKMAEKLVD
jgi:hypothetical protein